MISQRSITDPPSPLSSWSYFLDVDGTLVEMAATPDAVCFEPLLLQELELLRQSTHGAVAIVSGRSIADLDSYLGASQIPIAGLHGLERRDANGLTWKPEAALDALTSFRTTLVQHLSRHSGFVIEDKSLTIAVHYRQVPEQYTVLKDIMQRLVSETHGAVGLIHGKFVIEAVPLSAGKGFAVLDYLNEAPFHGRVPVFIGDDTTDEHAFAAVNQINGVSIKVGEGESCAAFRLPDVAAVRKWLGSMT